MEKIQENFRRGIIDGLHPKQEDSRLAGLKDLAFELIAYNKETGTATISETSTDFIVTVSVTVPKSELRKENAA